MRNATAQPRNDQGKKKGFLRRAARFAAPLAIGTGLGYVAMEAGEPLVKKFGTTPVRKKAAKFANYMASDVGGTAVAMGVDRFMDRKKKRNM